MTVELLQTLSIASYIAAAFFFLVAVALFFLLDVPKLYGDISGRTAKKAIEKIRRQNETSGNKAYKPSPVNAERGKITDRISHSGRVQSTPDHTPIGVGTEELSTSGNETTLLEQCAGETTLLATDAPAAGETTLLTADAPAAGETTLLTADAPVAGETSSLVIDGADSSPKAEYPSVFTIDVEMSFTGSSEIIE